MNYQELKEIVLKHSKLYYDQHRSEISDEEYDILYDKLKAVEKLKDGPTLIVLLAVSVIKVEKLNTRFNYIHSKKFTISLR